MRSPRARRSAALLAFAGAVLLALLTTSATASAYPWMIRHGYSTCTPCHADPSGAGLLTEYGRAQGELLLRTRYGAKKAEGEEEAGSVAAFLWGVKTPEWLLLGGSGRNLVLVSHSTGNWNVEDYVMQADAKAQVAFGRFRASGVLGYALDGDLNAAITQNQQGRAGSPPGNLISREHWLGLDLGEDKNFLLRAGRIEIPFGIRQIEHTAFVRMTTQTNIDDTQQYGVAFSYSGEKLRGEILGIAGNFAVNPDDFRQRGYAGFLELTLAQRATVGISSELTHAQRDPNLLVENVRMAHGAFTRLAPWKPLVIMFEMDAVANLPTGSGAQVGFANMLQFDYEPKQGVHLIATGESKKDPANSGISFGGWGSFAWFFLPHMDFRVDFVDQLVTSGATQLNTFSIGPQFHVYL